MKTVVVLLGLVAICAAHPHFPGYRATKAIHEAFFQVSTFFEKLAVPEMKHRVRRQSFNPACIQDLTEIQGRKFDNCSTVLSHFQDVDVLNRTEIVQFCHNDCPTFMINLLRKVARDCQLNDTLPDQANQELVLQTCKQGPNHKYCIEDWEFINPNTTMFPTSQDYLTCLATSDGSSCVDVCKRAEQWVTRSVGCCYRSILDFLSDIGENVILSEKYWDVCNQKEPTRCMN